MATISTTNTFRTAFVIGLPFTTRHGGRNHTAFVQMNAPQSRPGIPPNHRSGNIATTPVCCTKRDAPTEPVLQSTETAESVIRTFWSLVQTGRFCDTLPLFAEDAIYTDTLYPKPFIGISEVERHFKDMEDAIPPGLVFVLDDVAAGEDRVGVRWHVENKAGSHLPFSRGVSMYVLRRNVQEDGSTRTLIIEAWESVETPFKMAGVVLPALRLVSKVMKWLERN